MASPPLPALSPALHFRSDQPDVIPLSREQLDEGFSETRSQSDTDPMCMDTSNPSPPRDPTAAHLLNLPLPLRKYYCELLLKTLPNRAKESIAALCARLTRFDPLFILPVELVLHVLSYLSPHDLLTASAVSRAWRERARDENLWRACFTREGWLLDHDRMAQFEVLPVSKPSHTPRAVLARASAPTPPLERRSSRKRKTEEAFGDGEHAAVREDADDALSRDPSSEDMDGVEMDGSPRAGKMAPSDALMDFDTLPSASALATQVVPPLSRRLLAEQQLRITPGLFQTDTLTPKISWPYLYKQRCRLERNWDTGSFTTFTLPHERHPEEGHSECVYTIQHTNRHLVSGSRDRTIRIWDLEKYRLKRILAGHEASVLCLQFDERPDHDLIVSGGSDNWVIVWRFSTGQVIVKMTNAHTESVLNLRFDDRYLVTCSKDKTVKVWNRRALNTDDPIVPAHTLDLINNGSIHEGLIPRDDSIPPFSLLMKLEGHQAAVNAVMIHKQTIVSASGDRTIKAWDISSGRMIKQYPGHNKGIACVQFDGRRVVSGSSDNSVKIFDADTGAEVAHLEGHANLVRTVQARFGDLDIRSDEELELESRHSDSRVYQLMGTRPLKSPFSYERRLARNAGSSRPEDVRSLGTKVPPGGGGTRWAKIVSGSYDETVIVWKRDRDGKWVARMRLRQDQLARGLRAQARRNAQVGQQQLQPQHQHQPEEDQAPQQTQVQLTAVQTTVHQAPANPAGGAIHPPNPPNSPIVAPPPTPAQGAGLAAAFSNPVQLPPHYVPHLHYLQRLYGAPHSPAAQTQAPSAAPVPGPSTTPPGHEQLAPAGHHLHLHQAHVAGPPTVGAAANVPNVHPATAAPTAAPNPGNNNNPPANGNGNGTGTGNGHVTNIVLANAAPAHPRPAHGNGEGNTNRVFKLQFDTRRIVCCSQNRVIVGWDFANGDPELERIGAWSVETA